MILIPFKKNQINEFLDSIEDNFKKHLVEEKLTISMSLSGDTYCDLDLEDKYFKERVPDDQKSFFKTLTISVRIVPEEFPADEDDCETEFFIVLKRTKSYISVEINEYITTHFNFKNNNNSMKESLLEAKTKLFDILNKNKFYKEVLKYNKVKNF